MEALALAWQQVRVDRLTQQRVAKGVAGGRRVRREQVVLDGLSQRLVEVIFCKPRGCGEQRVIDRPSGHSGDLEHLAQLTTVTSDPREQGVTQRIRQALVGASRGNKQLFGEE